MLRRSILGLAVLATFALPLSAQNVDEIVSKHIEAAGGRQKLDAVKTVRITGKFSAGQIEASTAEIRKRPNMLRQELTLQGMTQVQAYDGKNGWQIDPFQGKKTAEAMSEDDLRATQESADFDEWAAVGPLVDYKQKGNTVELVGKEDVEGSPAYKLKITLKNGDVRTVYLDADSYVAIKQEQKRTIRGAEREFEGTIGDYKEEGGIMMPHSYEVGPKGSQQRIKVTVDKVEINPELSDSLFTMPAGTAPASPQADTQKKDSEKKPADSKKAEEKKDKPKQ